MMIDPVAQWVTVVMPVYNGERYLAQAIESILHQSHPHFESIIINDGSTDQTPQILDHYARHDPRIRVFHQANIDQPATLNRALQLAQHDWVAIIDHDDISLPTRLERQLQTVANHPHVRAVGSYAIEIDAQGNQIRHRSSGVTTEAEFQAIRDQNDWISLIHPSVLLHRPTVLALGGYDPAFGPSADTELWSRLADEHLILVVPEPLMLYRIHSQSMSATRFFEQRFTLRWILARQQARRQGLPIPSRTTFQRTERGPNKLGRLRVLRRDWAEYFRMKRQLGEYEMNTWKVAAAHVGIFTMDPYDYVRRKTPKVFQRLAQSRRS